MVKSGTPGPLCAACPRRCGAQRRAEDGDGVCAMGYLPRVARAAAHYGEEPCISGYKGSGTVFFSGCALACVYCQNREISQDGWGQTVSLSALRDMLESLAAQCHNVNLVSPSHYAEACARVLARPLPVPVVYNTGGYDGLDALRMLRGKVDVYLTDLKYRSPLLSARYSGAADYFDAASAAILEMCRQAGPCEFDGEGILRRGVLVRHLVLPGCSADSLRVLRWCRENLPEGVYYSIMAQYTPCGPARDIPALNRGVSPREYARVLRFAEENGLPGYFQSPEAAGTEEIPDFQSLTGVVTPDIE